MNIMNTPNSIGSEYCTSVGMMVFTLESLIDTHLGVKINESKKIFYEWFSTLLTNLMNSNEFTDIKILEWLAEGGWERVYRWVYIP